MHPPAVSLQCLIMMGAQPSCAGVGDDTAERHDPGVNLQLAKPHSRGSLTILLPTVP